MYSVGLIGFGSAGSRFMRSIVHRQRTVGDVRLDAVCDTNAERLALFESFPIKTYTDVTAMLAENQFDLLIVATNESSHYNVLCDIHRNHRTCKRILVEKLLVENLSLAEKIRSMFRETDIAVHFVERHSPVLRLLKTWMNEQQVRVSRASFFWGKFRLYDHRPTIGVISEISHPIDLITMLGDIPAGMPFEIMGGSYIFSDFSVSGDQVLDTINVSIKFANDIVVSGNSSFLWSSRRREIQLYLSNESRCVTHLVTLSFDNPRWDVDSCSIYKVNLPDGKSHLVQQWEVTEEDLIEAISCVNKTNLFVNANIEEVSGLGYCEELARLSQSVYIQEIIEAIAGHANQNKTTTQIFGDKRQDSRQYSENDPLLLEFLKGNHTGNLFASKDLQS
ncbi:Gfo/Idh/MocA family protein [Paenibacillus hexagrammi]|uniref:Gfo/Idh/MocA family oxidoreductase n=1 Tax=Paenibacillus hexagrammi TaxID=2908839 RepID=A0ABY3SQ64_9BACL|nr:Gfo/Idh/MocA family oxidoreductase [Paenibacillus sp. YPD9-1]UJF35535.1 Gfo/Idh/MocA family oxidoreductase [Paenibacillus sp. YPD9-1]